MDTKTIYEIFRACRLCGAGGGYRMPIIQSVVPVGFECNDIELRLKIRECTQMEVAPDDKMPPLICELCVDKVNDFYEFLDMVRNVNRRTRSKLGLPQLPMATPQGGSDGDCILGVTEPIFVEDSPAKVTPKPPPKKEKKPKGIKNDLQKLLKDVGTTVKIGKSQLSDDTTTATTPASTRTRHSRDKEPQEPTKPERPRRSSSSVTPRGLKRENQTPDWFPAEDDELLVPRNKRARDVVRTGTSETGKKLKITIKAPTQPDSPPPKAKPTRPGPRSLKPDPEPPKPTKEEYRPGPKSSKAQPKSVPKVEPKSVPKFDQKSVPKVELKPGPKVEAKPGPKVEPKPGPKVEPKPGPKVEPKPGPKVEAKPVPNSPKIVVKAKGSDLTPYTKTGQRFICDICGFTSKKCQGILSHFMAHTIGFTDPKKACDACGEWFVTVEEATDHHQWHKSGNHAYRCRRCHGAFKRNAAFVQHIENNRCVPWPKVPDPKCPACANTFVTRTLLAQHHCAKQDDQIDKGHYCSYCKKFFSNFRNLRRHETTCGLKKEKDVDSEPLTSSNEKDELLSVMAKRSATAAKKRGESKSAKKKDIDDEPLAKSVKKENEDEPLARSAKKKENEVEPARSAKKKQNLDEPLTRSTKKKDNLDEPARSVKKKENEDEPLARSARKKRDDAVKIPPAIRKKLRPMQVRMARCDSLVKKARARINVAHVSRNFGFDQRCVYPYRSAFRMVKVKKEPWTSDSMVSINQDRNEFYKEEDYVHWDSDLSSDEDDFENPKCKVDSLGVLALKTIFSRRCLGKVPRKLRKVKPDKALDSLFNVDKNDGDNCSLNINSIIDNIDKNDVKNDNAKKVDYGSDSLIEKDENRTKNEDFDSLFNNDKKNDVTETTSEKKDKTYAAAVKNNEKEEKNNTERSNLDGFDIDLSNLAASNLVNGDKVSLGTVNGSKDNFSDLDSDSLMKELDLQIGESDIKTPDKILGSESERDGVLDDFNKDSKTYLDRISDEEFNFDA